MNLTTAALFDLDGVIVDTENQYTMFWDTIGARFKPGVSGFAAGIKGQTLDHILETHFPSAELQETVRQALHDFEARMDFPEVPGAFSFVRALGEAGVPTAVVTSSNAEKMTQLYRRWPDMQPLFSAVLTAEDSLHSKPAPDCYLNAAARLRADIHHSLVFEDSLSGLAAGRSAGARLVALSTTNPAEEVGTLAAAVIPDFTGFTPADFYRMVR